MNIQDTLLAANDAETLLESLATTKYEDVDSVAIAVSELHNCNKINILSAYGSPQFDTLSQSFFVLMNVLCKTFPLLECSTEVAISTCENLTEKLGSKGYALYDSLTEWFRKKQERVTDGISLIQQDITTNRRLVKPVLLAGASHDAEKSTEEAMNLVNQDIVQIRLDAIWALGRIVPIDNDSLITCAVNHLERVIESPKSGNDIACSVETALILLQRTEGRVLQEIEPLLVKVCTTPDPVTFHSLAFGLQCHREYYSEVMIDMTLSALGETRKQDQETIDVIDSILYQWDLDEDRERILQFLVRILSHSDDTVELGSLDSFRHRLCQEPGSLLGWYVVSLLLTGDFRLCCAAAELLPHNESRDGLDIDLSEFSLTSPWILYLSRKLLGYCILKKESVAALLLSCLRAVSDSERDKLESLIREYFLMNYLTAIDCFEEAISTDDPAAHSVQRLSQEINSYINKLGQAGICPAFRPNEKERQLQDYRLADNFRVIQKMAESKSIFSSLVHKSTMLYGTAAISYMYTSDHGEPNRQEISLGTIEHATEIPRLDVLDPVGFHYVIHKFRTEPQPK